MASARSPVGWWGRGPLVRWQKRLCQRCVQALAEAVTCSVAEHDCCGPDLFAFCPLSPIAPWPLLLRLAFIGPKKRQGEVLCGRCCRGNNAEGDGDSRTVLVPDQAASVDCRGNPSRASLPDLKENPMRSRLFVVLVLLAIASGSKAQGDAAKVVFEDNFAGGDT